MRPGTIVKINNPKLRSHSKIGKVVVQEPYSSGIFCRVVFPDGETGVFLLEELVKTSDQTVNPK